MKKQVKIIIGVVIVLAIGIAVASYFYPRIKGDQTSGTIGKAEKFRKGQFTAEDILLRDDILKDTAAVGKTLDQILAFSSFMIQEKLIIDSVWIKEIKKTCPTYPGCTECVNCEKAVKLLEDYSTFVQNNKETVQSTIAILMAAYNGKQKDYTFDVGVKMLSFVQFVDEMIKRDSAFTNAIKLVDQYITKEKTTDKKRQAALTKLKQVRDHMVIDNLLFAMKTGDKKQADMVASIPLSSAGNVNNVVNSADQVNSSNPTNASAVRQASDNLQNVFNSVGVGSVTNISNAGVYSSGRIDAAVYGSVFCSAGSNNAIFRNTGAINSAIGLNNVTNFGSVGQVVNLSEVIGVGYSNVFSAAELNIVVSNTGTVFSNGIIEPY